MARLVILYEDSRGPLQRFPLHDLVVKSAADLVSLDVHELFRRVIAVPKKGVNKVLDEVARCDRFLKGSARFLVWVDNDRIRRALQLATACTRGAVISEIKARAPAIGDLSRPKPLEVFLLDDNLEGLLSCVGAQLDPECSQRQRQSGLTRAICCSTRSVAVHSFGRRCARTTQDSIAIRGVRGGHGFMATSVDPELAGRMTETVSRRLLESGRRPCRRRRMGCARVTRDAAFEAASGAVTRSRGSP